MHMHTGESTFGKGGHVTAYVGTGDFGPGGDVFVHGGNSIDPKNEEEATGGHIHIQTGFSEYTSSGRFRLWTPNAGSQA